ncbi:hypothetical protein CA54_09430 [Symmachiella macrocystis]|uniref:Uncharacterized protein n=1 Tax=Symmachiella macrocystis TaxID=2527985 RepID=A0A5C6BJ89_9PLAN|nr:hypothetical protein CA54_09430 [Symmachiella macrocystis]
MKELQMPPPNHIGPDLKRQSSHTRSQFGEITRLATISSIQDIMGLSLAHMD